MEAEMKKRFTEKQIVKILAEQDQGKKVRDIAREYGISENTFFIWKKKYGGMSSSEIRRLKQLEAENANPKKLVAELSLDNMMQKEVIKSSQTRNEKDGGNTLNSTFQGIRKTGVESQIILNQRK